MSYSVFNHRRALPYLSSDSFNRADGLPGSTDGKGALDPLSWTRAAFDTGTNGLNIFSNKISDSGPDTTFNGYHALYVDLTLSDVELWVDGSTSNVSSFMYGLLFRFTDINNFWAAMAAFDSNLYLYKRSAGTETLVNSTAIGTRTTKVRVMALGSAISVYFGSSNSPTITTTDSFNSTATKHGLVMRNTPTGTGNASSLDNWIAYRGA